MSTPTLAYVAVAANDVAAVSRVFQDEFGLARRHAALGDGTSVPLFSIGETAIAVFEAGHPFLGAQSKPGVDHIAVAARDPGAYAEAAGLPPSGSGVTAGIDGVRQLVLDAGATCGVRVRICEPVERADGGGPRVERIDHIGVASRDIREAGAVFTGRLGFSLESTQTDMEVRMAVESFTSDKYGVVYHSRPPEPVGGLRVSFITTGDFELEFLQPFDPSPVHADAAGPAPDRPGNTRGDRGAIGRFLERRGPGLHHLALKTPEINALLPALAASGLRMIDLEGRPGSRRALIGFVHPASLGGLLVHFVERREL